MPLYFVSVFPRFGQRDQVGLLVGAVFAEQGIFFAHLFGIIRRGLRIQQVCHHSRALRCIFHIHHSAPAVFRFYFQRRMQLRRGGAADEQRHTKAGLFHFGGNNGHLFKRRRDQPAQSHNIGLFADNGLYNFFRRDHHSQIHNFVIVARQHDGNDIFSNVMHIAFHGCQHNFPGFPGSAR
ncbi:hypothetical protein SDC9_108204 [bioreactor metagenome]|uniref:Uncharacterized protein n=1 Tax=bioreactor metagenome TaxID=1076179 RepID=A0A645B8F9_9ZZZZ